MRTEVGEVAGKLREGGETGKRFTERASCSLSARTGCRRPPSLTGL